MDQDRQLPPPASSRSALLITSRPSRNRPRSSPTRSWPNNGRIRFLAPERRSPTQASLQSTLPASRLRIMVAHGFRNLRKGQLLMLRRRVDTHSSCTRLTAPCFASIRSISSVLSLLGLHCQIKKLRGAAAPHFLRKNLINPEPCDNWVHIEDRR